MRVKVLFVLLLATLALVAPRFGADPIPRLGSQAAAKGAVPTFDLSKRRVILVQGIDSASDCSAPVEKSDRYEGVIKKLEDIGIQRSQIMLFSYGSDYVRCPDSSKRLDAQQLPDDPNMTEFTALYGRDATCRGVESYRDYLKDLIDRYPSDTQFDLIGHSLGGLIVSYFVATQSDDFVKNRIHSVITVDSMVASGQPYDAVIGWIRYNWNLPAIGNSACPEDAKSWQDIEKHTGTIKKINEYKNTTQRATFVSINSSFIGQTIPGEWRRGTCEQDGSVLPHGCIFDAQDPKRSNALAEIADAVQTNVLDDGGFKDAAAQTRAGIKVEIGGSWQKMNDDRYLARSYSETTDSKATLKATFNGTAINIVYSGQPKASHTRTGSDAGATATFSLDGKSEDVVTTVCDYSKDNDTWGPCTKRYDGLSPGPHTLEISVKRTSNQTLEIDRLEVPSPNSGGQSCNSGQPVDIALIIDSSGSMGQNDPNDLRLAAAKLVLNTMKPGDGIAVIKFSTSATVVQPMTTIDANNKSAIESAISAIRPEASTDIGDGIAKAAEQLSLGKSSRKAAILLTDGLQTEGSYNNQHLQFRDKSWPIYAVGLSAQADQDLLNRIAADTGTGKFIFLKDASTVQPAYAQIAVQANCGRVAAQAVTPLQQGQRQQLAVSVPQDQQIANFVASWPGSTVDLSLVDPSGRTIDANSQAANIIHAKALTFEVYQISDPAAGDWKMRIFGRDIPAASEDVTTQLGVIPKPAAQAAASVSSGGGTQYAIPAILLTMLAVVLSGVGIAFVRPAMVGAGAGLVLPDGHWRGISRRSRTVEVGRAPGNDVVLNDEYVSRRHFRIRHDGAAYALEDLGSSSGTSVNGVPSTTSTLNDGDTIEVGQTRLVFRLRKPR